ncbi:MAG: hypothetical protein ISS95_01340 [Candidatus Aenigmarchaeota archaeon]|nr:hypothetical protein [Candidatus Aenigmarchaeota archaeon]
MFKKIFLLTLVFALFAVPVFSLGMNVKLDYNQEVLTGESLPVKIIIENSGYSDLFSISVIGTPETNNWYSVKEDVVSVKGGSSGETVIMITPPKNADSKFYRYSVTVTSMNSKESLEKEILFFVKKRSVSGGVKELSMSCTSCSDELYISFLVSNNGQADLDGVEAVVKAGEQQRVFKLGEIKSDKAKKVSTTFSLKDVKPARYDMEIEITSDKGKLDSVGKYFIIPVVSDVKYDKKVRSNILGNFITITASNEGNDENEIEIKSEVRGRWWDAFIGPEPYDKEGGLWTWKKNLKPGEGTEIEYIEFHWPIPIFFVGIILTALYIYIRMTNMTITKTIMGIGGGRDISVSLKLKNMGKDAERVVVRDVIDPNFSVVGSFESLKPLIRKIAAGTELIWKFGKVNHGDERVLHYKVKPKFSAKKTTMLPAARVTGKAADKTIITQSNRPIVSGVKSPEPKLKVG